MIPLLKIRTKYLKGHLTSLIIFHIIIPISFFIFSLFSLLNKNKQNLTNIKKSSPYSDKGEFYLFPNETEKYNNIIFFLDEVSLVSEDEKECKSFADFLKIELNLNNSQSNKDEFTMEKKEFKCYKKEDELHPGEDGILIIKKNEKYEFQFIKHNSYTIFDFRLISLENNIDLFNVEKLALAEKSDYKVHYSKFLELQSLIAKYLIYKKKNNFVANQNLTNMKISIGINQYPEHNNFYMNLGQDAKNRIILVFCMVIGFIFSLYFYFFNLRILEEKDQKLDLFLRRFGISNIKYIFSWFISFISMNFLFIISFCLLFKVYLPFHSLLFVINIILFILSSFSVSVFFYICIPSLKVANTIIKFYYLGFLILGCGVILDFASRISKIIFAFIPHINLFHCTYTIVELQIFENLSWEKLWLKANKISYMESIIMYLVDIIFYLLLSLLIQKFKQLKFFRNLCNKKKVLKINDIKLDPKEKKHQIISSNNEKINNNKKSLKLINVSKNYEGIEVLNNLNAEFYSDEIFCILGTNGSGKSTLMNIISGIITPDNGGVIYNERSLLSNKLYLYQSISSCQQENIFFDYLTVHEHLKLIQEIKTGGINHDEIFNLLKLFNLFDKKDYLCNTLSGGQKRKLCTTLALISNSPIILLDEPSSGMDMETRKRFWGIIKGYKKDKIIIITTHSLEEAENLGERIGILSEGEFICSGTSSFLKEKYPCGFTINISLNSKINNFEENRQTIINHIKNIEPTIQYNISFKGNISINIKNNINNISNILNYLEESKELGVEDYMLSSTSLEDIFYLVNKKKNIINEDIKINIDENDNYLINNNNNNINIVSKSFCSQLILYIKRTIFFMKKKFIIFLFELILSIFAATILFLIFFKEWLVQLTYKKRNFDLISVLEANRNYIYDKQNFLQNSFLYDSSNIVLKKIDKEPKNITDFIRNIYDNSFANIAKGSICIKKLNNSIINKYIYDIYNTEIYTGNFGNVYANTILLVSAFLKNEYNIDASILTKVKYNYLNNKKVNYYKIFKDFFSLIIMGLWAAFGLLLLLAGLASEKINERKNNIKRFIYLNGGNLVGYWISYFIIDLIKIMMFSSLLLISTFSINNSGGYFIANMASVSLSSLFFIYFISYFCSKEDSVIKFSFIYLIISVSITFIFQYFNLEKNIFDLITNKFEFTTFDLNPITSMIFSLIRLSYNFCAEPTQSIEPGLRPVTIVLWNSLTVQAFNLIAYGALFLFVECGLLDKILHCLKNIIILRDQNYFKTGQDSDYNIDNSLGPLLSKSAADSNLIEGKSAGISMGAINFDMEEEEEISLGNEKKSIDDNADLKKINNLSRKNSNLNIDPLSNQYVLNELNRLKNSIGFLTKIGGLKKTFCFCCKKNIKAVNNLFLGLELNEKFGLLGYNGSGKTVTFKMIINEILYDTGTISLFGKDNKKNFNKINSIIGYCPQENHLFEYMKVKEIIKFFVELKTNDENVETICREFDLNNYSDTLYCNLSGGNKRKLALAIALMNKPSLLLLDEPSTGMDLFSKNMMLNNINSVTKGNQRYNMILTTHSPKEAELICDRVSWFNNGNFTFIGNPNEIKKQTNNLYKLYIKFDQSKYFIDEVPSKEKVEETFKTVSELVNNFKIYSNYFITNPELELQLDDLNLIVNKIKEDVKSIETYKVGTDNSYEFYLETESRAKLFSKIIELKNSFSKISEIRIGKESLENILTSFKLI